MAGGELATADADDDAYGAADEPAAFRSNRAEASCSGSSSGGVSVANNSNKNDFRNNCRSENEDDFYDAEE